MRILFLNPEAFFGGAERCLIDLFASMRAHDSAIDLGLIVGGDGPLVQEAERFGVRVIRLELPPALATLGDSGVSSRRASTGALAKNLGAGAAALTQYVAKLRREIALFSPEIVQSNGMKMHMLGALARPRNARLVWYVHDFVSERRIASRALRALSRRAHLAVTNSAAVRDDFAKTVRAIPARVVLNAIDTDDFTPSGESAPLEELAGITPNPNAIRVGLLATFARWKGQDVFLEAAKLVRERAPDLAIRFFIVGSALYRTDAQFSEAELRAKANELGIADAVAFVPFQNDAASLYRALDVVVHASSRPEPFGRTLVEAMACGRAVIGVAEGGAAEIIRHDENALAIPPRDPKALADAIVRLAKDASARELLGEKGRADAVARFSRERLAGDMLRAYQAIGD